MPVVSSSSGRTVASGGYIYHIFTTTGVTNNITFSTGGTVEYLIIAGGGAGGSNYGGGGGAGEVVYGSVTANAQNYSLTVGAGGTVSDTNGGNSIGFSITTAGGGKGSGNASGVGSTGGSGGGGSGYQGNMNGYASSKLGSGLGFAGGNGDQTNFGNTAPAGGGGGGGGAGSIGVIASNTAIRSGGAGGNGTSAYTYWINAIASTMNTIVTGWSSKTISAGIGYIASGGSGGSWGSYNAYVSTPAVIGGGGAGGVEAGGSMPLTAPLAGTLNTGGGGGGGGAGGGVGANGGSGLIVIRYSTWVNIDTSISISSSPYTLGSNVYGTDPTTRDPPKLGVTCYTTSSSNCTIINPSGNYVLGGGGGAGTAAKIYNNFARDYYGGNGGHAINNTSNNITIYNYGYLLGGGGAGYTNGNGSGGIGGAGGGGGGSVYSVSGDNGGSLKNIDPNGFGGHNSIGGGGGPGGIGGTGDVNGVKTSASGGTTSAFGIYKPSSIYAGGYGGGVATNTNSGGGGGGGYSNNDPPNYSFKSTDTTNTVNLVTYNLYDVANNAGLGGYSIYNTSGTISALYNSQGGNNNNIGPLYYAGVLPTKYYITVNSPTNYGQLYYIGWYFKLNPNTNTNYNSIGIDPASTFSGTFTNNTIPCVLLGNCFVTTNLPSGSQSLYNGYTVNWKVVKSADTTIEGTNYATYDLQITSYTLIGQINALSLYVSGSLNSVEVTNPSYNVPTATSTFSNPSVSVYATNIIASGVGFAVNSDQRIKKNIQYLDSTDSYELVKALKPASFQYVDFLKGTVPKYGYLAQEVEAVLPYTVNRNTGYIPTIFEMVTIDKNKIVLNEKTTETLAIGTKVQFYDAEDMALFRQVVEIVDEKTCMVNEGFIDVGESLFLYGQEVADYRSIDTDQMNTVMLSAFQEIQKRLEKQQKEIAELRR